VLHLERDWVHVGAPAQYAREMVLREALLLGRHAARTYLSVARSVAAEQEARAARPPAPRTRSVLVRRRVAIRRAPSVVPAAPHRGWRGQVLDLLVPWLLRHYPLRFASSGGGASRAIATLTEGYERRFVLAEWATRPLLLVGLLVQARPASPATTPAAFRWSAAARPQGPADTARALRRGRRAQEDWYLLEEQDAAAPPDALLPGGEGAQAPGRLAILHAPLADCQPLHASPRPPRSHRRSEALTAGLYSQPLYSPWTIQLAPRKEARF
jgi:hypothetical protein